MATNARVDTESSTLSGHLACLGEKAQDDFFWRGKKEKSLFRSCFVHLPGSDLQLLLLACLSLQPSRLIYPPARLDAAARMDGRMHRRRELACSTRTLRAAASPCRRRIFKTTLLVAPQRGTRRDVKAANEERQTIISTLSPRQLLLHRDCGFACASSALQRNCIISNPKLSFEC